VRDAGLSFTSERANADAGRRFLAFVDLLGTTYSASTLATGYGAHIAQPLLRRAVEGNEDTLTEEEARKIIEQSMQVLFYRDARSLDKVRLVSRPSPLVLMSCSTKLLQLPLRVCTFPIQSRWRRLGRSRREYGVTVRRRSRCCMVSLHK
jgi:hypothetical protein